MMDGERRGEDFRYPEECRLEAAERCVARLKCGKKNELLRQDTKLYLCVPYSHKNPAVRKQRFAAANVAAGRLMQMGYAVFSPISHSHPVAETIGEANALSHEFWLRQDFSFIEWWADKIGVLMLPGWDESTGIRLELERVKELNAGHGWRTWRVAYLDPETLCEVQL